MPNRVCEILGIEKPVVQAPMYWITDARLCAAVSNAGGMGTLCFHAGQNSLPKDKVEQAERLRDEIRKTKELTTKPFGVNLLPMKDPLTPLLAQVMYDEKIPVAFVAGDNEEDELGPLFKDLKEHGLKIVYRPLNPTPARAQMAERLGADIFVATGIDEGGTLPGQIVGTFSIVPLIVDSVKIPVMAAGGITDSRTFNAALALGAEGAYCGTAFIASTECRAAQNVKEAMLPVKATDMHFFRTVPDYYRSIPTPLSTKLVEMDKELKTNKEIADVMHPMRNMKFGMLDGQMDVGYVSVGLGVSFIHSIKSCDEIIKDLTKDWKC